MPSSQPNCATWLLVGDRTKIEPGVRELNLREMLVLDAERNPATAAAGRRTSQSRAGGPELSFAARGHREMSAGDAEMSAGTEVPDPQVTLQGRTSVPAPPRRPA